MRFKCKPKSYGQNGCGFRNICSKKFQEMPSLDKDVYSWFRELEKNTWNLRGSYKLILNYERKLKAWVVHSIENSILRKAKRRAKN